MKRTNALEAARQIVAKHFPNCQGALLAGSVVRNEATETSDLDIVIFDTKLEASYRESFKEFGWPVEVFVHTLSAYKSFFISDCERAGEKNQIIQLVDSTLKPYGGQLFEGFSIGKKKE